MQVSSYGIGFYKNKTTTVEVQKYILLELSLDVLLRDGFYLLLKNMQLIEVL